MASKLKSVDLTGAIVGTTGVIDFNQFSKFNPQTMEKAHLRLLNESGAGLDIVLKASGNSHFLPAGAWGTFDLEPNDASVGVTVAYVLPNPPVSMLIGLYYMPGEQVPQAFTLGNSPIGIGGSISTSNTTLSNELNATGTQVIDIGPAFQAITIWNDHFNWSVVQGGVGHQVLKGNTIGNPLQIGQAGDATEVLGQLQVDQATTLAAVGLLTHILGSLTVDQTALITGVLTAVSAIINTINSQAATNLALNVPTGQTISLQVNAVEQAHIDATGIILPNQKKLTGNASSNLDIDIPSTSNFVRLLNNAVDVLDATNTGPRLGTGMTMRLIAGSISAIATGTVSIGAGAAVVVNHGMAGISAALLTTNQSLSSGTNSAYTYTSTQFTAFNGAGATLVYRWVAYNA